jgi:signal transduction histidine kinase
MLFVSYRTASGNPTRPTRRSTCSRSPLPSRSATAPGTGCGSLPSKPPASRPCDAEQERMARQTVLDERTRIARELHDLVAHSMSIVAVQAGVGHYLIDRDPAQAKDGARDDRDHQPSGAHRDAPDARRAALDTTDDPGADDQRPRTPARVERHRHARRRAADNGLDVDLVVEPDGAMPDLPSGVALSAYRIVQEALTNVRKHAGPARVTVTFAHDADQLDHHRRRRRARRLDDGGRRRLRARRHARARHGPGR